MKILYGVVGEGMGHAMRSRVVLEHLVSQGHEVSIMASGRAVEFLSKHFSDVHRIHGFHMITDENRVRKGRTLWSNVLKGSTGLPRNIGVYFDQLNEFSPDAVISDFESWTYLYAKAHGLPVFSIDNMQIINRCVIPSELVEGERASFEIAKAFVKSKLPFCDHYLITTFFRPEIRKDRTALYPPILRPDILAARPSQGDHLLVYQTAEGNTALADALAQTGLECRIYGMRRSITDEQVEGNLRYRPFAEAGFIHDLASARGVIAGGGFTLMGEAVYLHKPMLSVPLEQQFEQILNARYLQRVGYGMYAPRIDSQDPVRRFVEMIPACQAELARYEQDGNRLILEAVDHLLDRVAAGLYS